MKLVYIFIILALSVLSHWLWFSGLSVITSGDWGFFFRETQKELWALPQIWTTNGFGSVYLSMPMYPSNLLWGLLAQISDFTVSERVLYLFPSALLGGISAYFLVNKLTKSSVGGFIGGVTYAFNTYFILLQASGHMTLLVSYALAPLLIFLVMEALERDELKFIILAGLLSFVMSFYEFRVLLLAVVVVSLYFMYYWFVLKRCSTAAFKIVFKIGALFGLMLALLNSYWLAMWLAGGYQDPGTLFGRGLFGDSFMNIIRAMTLFHPFWTWNTPTIFVVQQVPAYFFVIPIAAIIGLWANRKNKMILFFGLISLLGILLTKQSAEPFPQLYKWLYNYLPGFQAFRESSKFYFFIALGYSVLIGAFISWLWNYQKINRVWVLTGKILVTVLLVLVFFGDTWPLITGNIGTMFIPKTMPADYLLIKNFFAKQNEYFRTLWVPTDPRWAYYSNLHPKVSLLVAEQTAWQEIYKSSVKADDPTQSQIVSMIDLPSSEKLLSASGIKYVIVPMQDIGNDDDFFQYYGPRRFFLNSVSKTDYLQKLDLGTDTVAVYENRKVMPHIYLTAEMETILKTTPYTRVDFQAIRPTEYHLKLPSIQGKTYLNFSESYKDGWKIRVGKFSWWEAIMTKDYSLSGNIHQKTDAGFNSFELNTAEIAKRYKSSEITIYYAPQGFVYLGSVISGTTLIILSALSIYLVLKKHGRN